MTDQNEAAEAFVPLEMEYIDLESIQVMSGNPKDHDIGDLIASFEQYGFRNPVGIDGYGGGLTAVGHGRLQALLTMQRAGMEAPAHVEVATNGHWFIPAVKGFKSANEELFRGYRTRANQSTFLGGWLDDALVDELNTLSEANMLGLSGFDEADLARLDEPPIDATEQPAWQTVIRVFCETSDTVEQVQNFLGDNDIRHEVIKGE